MRFHLDVPTGAIVMFQLFGWFLLIYGGRIGVRLIRAREWPSCEGIIAQSEVILVDGVWGPDIVYEYAVQGRRNRGDVVFLNAKWIAGTGEVYWREVISRFPVGARCVVHYNPRDVGDAFLEKGSLGGWLVLCAAGAAFVVFSGVAILQ